MVMVNKKIINDLIYIIRINESRIICFLNQYIRGSWMSGWFKNILSDLYIIINEVNYFKKMSCS